MHDAFLFEIIPMSKPADVPSFLAPIPSGVQTILATICKDVPGAHNDTTVWLYSRGEGQCQPVDTHSLDEMDIQMANRLVYVFQV